MLDVVYVMGTSHCGSTLLAFLLNTHPDIFSIGEFGARAQRIRRNNCSCGKFVDECPLWLEVSERVTSEVGFDFSVTNGVANFGFRNRFLRHKLNTIKTNTAIDKIRKGLLNLSPFYQIKRKRALYVNEVAIRTILEITNSKVFVDTSKSPHRFVELSQVAELNLKIIWLVRDVRGFAGSSKRKNRRIEESAIRWKNEQTVIKQIYDDLPDNERLLIRYEDLCRDPMEVMKSIFHFIGVTDFAVPDDYKSVPHHIFGNRMKRSAVSSISFDEKWKRELSREEQELALRKGGEIASILGYK
jgi:hypothetical protein